ncbi:RNA polymerase sigma factor (sigma-70 family) [Paenibacillus turicensis]|uniref:RNA polymerase sigma factor n=1 Tax=Paenibacillus turicensis TaxID=160487 RepID=A0ABS4FU44_9BACL|nr:RNA polymerase sigma factor [Paenibacillus turicensis]MBP1906101.1 RNA polymerase sigma factor (sigma-70 family) [Paenibacillus turicensis]
MLNCEKNPVNEEDTDIEAIGDDDLIDLAKTGDHDAFGELVRRHRTKAFGWAQKLTQDPFVAEDIAQDALIRAFLHLGDLVDTQRFKPWLRRIVHNLAYMKLRRGGPYSKEMPFTSYDSLLGNKSTRKTSIRNWDSIDQVLYHLHKSVTNVEKYSLDPISIVIRKETIDGIRELLSCLSKREKDIFESYFFNQLRPAEIAAMFQTSTSNIYNYISASRRKVQQQRLKVQINVYIKMRRDLGLPVSKKLPCPR